MLSVAVRVSKLSKRRSPARKRLPGLFGWGLLGVANAMLTACSSGHATGVNFPFTVQKERTLGTPSAAVAVAWSPDGSKVAAAVDWGTNILVWDETGRKLDRFPSGSYLSDSFDFGANGNQVLSFPQDSSLAKFAFSVLDAKSGRYLRNISLPDMPSINQATSYEASPDHRFIAVVLLSKKAEDPDVALYETGDWQLVRTYATGGATTLNFFERGRKLVIGSFDNKVTILDINSPDEIGHFVTSNRASIEAVAGSPDGRFVFAGQVFAGDGAAATAMVFRASDGTRVASYPIAARSGIRQARWDPKGRYLALLGKDGHLILWRPFSAHPSYEDVSIPDAGLMLAVSPDGRRIAVACDRGVDIFSVN